MTYDPKNAPWPRINVGPLTKAQLENVKWAADALNEYWENETDERIENAIRFNGTYAEIVCWREVLEDLKYRLTVQLPDVADNEDDQVRSGAIRAAENAWQKIADTAAACGLYNIEVRE